VTIETVEAWAGRAAADDERPEWLLPVDAAFPSLPRLDLDRVASLYLRQGRSLPLQLPAGARQARAYDPAGGSWARRGDPGRVPARVAPVRARRQRFRC